MTRKPSGYWIPEKIDNVFDQLREDLNRTPNQTEFSQIYGGALRAIVDGRYSSNIFSWNDYLRNRNIKLNRETEWASEKIDKAFDELKEELGRNPNHHEFSRKFGGVVQAIRNGKYNPHVHSWNEYLRSRGLTVRHEMYKWKGDVVDKVFDELKNELGRAPSLSELEKQHRGAVKAILDGRYNPQIKTWSDYLRHREIEHQPQTRWSPGLIDKVFDELKEKLGRAPTYEDFKKEHSGALTSIQKGRYRTDIKNWTGYLRHRGFETDKLRTWTQEKIDSVFDDLRKKLNRNPTTTEFPSGAIVAIERGRYHKDVRNWTTYLISRGIKPTYKMTKRGTFSREKIDEAFNEMKEGLGRTPMQKEFGKKYPGAFARISNGGYDGDIHSWSDYLKHLGFKINHEWVPEEVDRAFDELKEKLGRTPTSSEMCEDYSGALGAIRKGNYSLEIRNWNAYLRHRGIKLNNEIGKWTPEKVDEAFDELRQELGRIPTNKEFTKRKGGAYALISKGRYNPKIRKWREYLAHRGVLNGRIRSSKELTEILRTETNAQYAVRLVGGDEIDLADILVVVYEGRLTRKDIVKFSDDPSFRDYLGQFKQSNNILDIIEPAKHLLELDKNGVIRRIVFRRLRTLRREFLGSKPTQVEQQKFLDELNEQMEELVA